MYIKILPNPKRFYKTVYHYYIIAVGVKENRLQTTQIRIERANNEQTILFFPHSPETMVHSGHIIFNMRHRDGRERYYKTHFGE